MNKEEKRARNKQFAEKQLNLEKEFHKTLFGKIIRIVLILAIITMALGLISAFSFHVFSLKESVFEFADKCMRYSDIPLFVCSLIYCFLPNIMSKDKSSKK